MRSKRKLEGVVYTVDTVIDFLDSYTYRLTVTKSPDIQSSFNNILFEAQKYNIKTVKDS